MADGRDIVAGMIERLEANCQGLASLLPGELDQIDKTIEGFKTIQKKFFLKTQGGTDSAAECEGLLNQALEALQTNNAELPEKLTAFSVKASNLITTTSNWVIRMT